MSLLKPIENGRMYPGWWRWNPIGGCKHWCSYCSIKRIEKRVGTDMTTPVFRDGTNGTMNYMNDNLGSGRKIFVCSSGDMWGEWITPDWTDGVLSHCAKYPDNEYMFLTKNPIAYQHWGPRLQDLNCILGTTIETDVDPIAGNVSDAMNILGRLYWIAAAKQGAKTMISVEPIMTFSGFFADDLRNAAPNIVNIGADSGNNGLPEPSADELRGLIAELETFTEVIQKKGLERLLD